MSLATSLDELQILLDAIVLCHISSIIIHKFQGRIKIKQSKIRCRFDQARTAFLKIKKVLGLSSSIALGLRVLGC